MNKKLKTLFEFQKFEGNRELQEVIDSVHARYGARELDLDELDMVNAAGDVTMNLVKKDPEKKNV